MPETFSWSNEQEQIFAWFSKSSTFEPRGGEHLEFENPDTDYIEIDADGHLVVIARAGTGKTTTILEGAKRAPERSIWVAAFGKDIQLVLEGKLKEIGAPPHIKAKTIHSVGLSCISRYRSGIKISFNSDRADALTEKVCGATAPDAIKRLITTLHTKGREMTPHARVLGDLTNIAIQFECEPDEEWANSGFPLEYVEQKALEAMELGANIQNGATIDGSDMIFLPVRNHWLTKQFDLIVVDETQDLTVTQLEICLGVLKAGGRICLVGDPRQAIYAWRGADSNSMDRLREELHAGVLKLTTTYRCGKVIVELAQRFVPDFNAHESNPEGDIQQIHTSALVAAAGPGDFVLSRVNAPIVGIAMKLLRAGKRTKVQGKDIGKGIVGLIRKLRARSVPDLLVRIERWAGRETERLTGQLEAATNGRKKMIQSKIEEILDRAQMLAELAEGAKSIDEMTTRIEGLFVDKDNLGDDGVITCSSVHKAKGLERKRVFILADTLRNWNIEEQNIEYVAITRAKQTLVWVTDNGEHLGR